MKTGLSDQYEKDAAFMERVKRYKMISRSKLISSPTSSTTGMGMRAGKKPSRTPYRIQKEWNHHLEGGRTKTQDPVDRIKFKSEGFWG